MGRSPLVEMEEIVRKIDWTDHLLFFFFLRHMKHLHMPTKFEHLLNATSRFLAASTLIIIMLKY